MTDKIDLDDLERKASAAQQELWRVHFCSDQDDGEACGICTGCDDDGRCDGYADVLGSDASDECSHPVSLVDAEHMAANSPPVTLALVARIRELERINAERLEQNERMCREIERLDVHRAALQVVVDAADDLTRTKREAEKVFRTGLAGMPELVRISPLAKGLADATSKAGMKLERAIDAHRARHPR